MHGVCQGQHFRHLSYIAFFAQKYSPVYKALRGFHEDEVYSLATAILTLEGVTRWDEQSLQILNLVKSSQFYNYVQFWEKT